MRVGNGKGEEFAGKIYYRKRNGFLNRGVFRVGWEIVIDGF